MKNKQVYLFSAIGIILLILTVLFFINREKTYYWYQDYKMTSDEPYGESMVFELLKNYHPRNTFKVTTKSNPTSEFQINSVNKRTYLFIGFNIPNDSTYINSIESFVEKGNTAFIAANAFPAEFLSDILQDSCIEQLSDLIDYETDSITNFYLYPDFVKPRASFKYAFKNKIIEHSYSYFDSTLFCSQTDIVRQIGNFNSNYINFIKINYGSGHFYLFSTPIIFTNYALKSAQNLEYAENVFSYLPNQDIIWDEYSKSITSKEGDSNSEMHFSKSPLSFILSQPSLRWAWYVLLAFVLMYLIYFGKRKQRIIPVIQPNENTSLEFVKTIGALYYQQHNHKLMCIKKFRLFQNFIRNRYYIKNMAIDDNYFQYLAAKSGVKEQEIRMIFATFHLLEKENNILDQDLVNFHLLIENFYKNCK